MPQLQQMASSIKSLQGGNMNEMLAQTLGRNNPMLQTLMQGGSAEQMVRQKCQEQGINVDELMGTMSQAFNAQQ